MKSLINLIILLLIFSCAENRENNQEVLVDNKSKNKIEHYETIIIQGVSDDPVSLNFINVIDHKSLSIENYKQKSKLHNGTWSLELDSIFNPRFMEFWALGDEEFYRAEIFTIPGDTILFEIKNKKILFKGGNANLNNFYTELYNSTPDYAQTPYKGNLRNYKIKLKEIYDTRIDFFNQYIENHNIQSEEFKTAVTNNLRFEYLNDLIRPRTRPSSDPNIYFGSMHGLNMILERENNMSENLFDINSYLDDVSIDEFKNSNLLSNKYFKNSISYYIRHYFNDNDYPLYSKEKLISEKNFIEKNFQGELKNFLIVNMIYNYHSNGFGNSISNIDFMNNLISNYEDELSKNVLFIKVREEIKADTENFNFSLSEMALDSKLLNKKGDTTSLNEIMNRSKNRIRVINFWASWCSACIDEFTKATNFKDKLTAKKSVEWIYLSIDEDKEKWLKKSEELREYLNFSDQYLILNAKKTTLTKELNISWIPRYVIFNKENNIVLNNAPRPSDSIAYRNIIENIK